MRRVKVAFFHDKFPLWGAERATEILSEQLNKVGYEVYIFARKFDFSTSSQKLPNSSYITLPNRIKWFSSDKFITNKINELEIDIAVFCVMTPSSMARIKAMTSCNIVFMLHNEPFWELKYKVVGGLFNRDKSIGKFLKWYIIQWPKYCLFGALKPTMVSTYRRIYDNVDIFGALCGGYVETLERELGVSRDESRFRTIHNPAIPQEDPIMSKQKRVLFVGRLTYADKRVDRLILAWSEIYKIHPDWELHIVGSGADENYFKQLALDLKLKNITFMGYSKNPIKHYREASILCMTSSTEGMPNVLYEAQMYGVVPIAINCCKGIEELLSPSGVNGVLVESEGDFADELSRLILDDQLRATIQRSAYVNVNKYGLNRVVEDWTKLIEELKSH